MDHKKLEELGALTLEHCLIRMREGRCETCGAASVSATELAQIRQLLRDNGIHGMREPEDGGSLADDLPHQDPDLPPRLKLAE